MTDNPKQAAKKSATKKEDAPIPATLQLTGLLQANPAPVKTPPADVKPRRPIPGSDEVGRGIKVIPRRPYELKASLLKKTADSPVYIGSKSYLLPKSHAVQESPQLPEGASLGTIVIVKSADQLDSMYSLDSKVAAGFGAFTISAGGDYSKSVRSSSGSTFAVRTSFVALWSVSLPNPDTMIALEGFKKKFQKLMEKTSGGRERETNFDLDANIHGRMDVKSQRDEFDEIFSHYGTHYVSRVWVGGKATFNIIVTESSNIENADIYLGLSGSFGSTETELGGEQKTSRTKLLENSEVVVWGEGGDKSLLAKLASLGDGTYEQWLGSIPAHPQVIEMEVRGIWTLVRDPEERQLASFIKAAYERYSDFRTISAMATVDWIRPAKRSGKAPKSAKILYIIREGDSIYGLDVDDSSQPDLRGYKLYGEESCPLHEGNAFRPIDAAANLPRGRGMVSKSNDLLYFFSGNEYVVYDPSRSVELDAGTREKLLKRCVSPAGKHVVEHLLDHARRSRVDEILANVGCKNAVIKTLINKNVVEERPPTLVQHRMPINDDAFPGLTFPKVDAAFFWAPGKAYFFYHSEYVRFDVLKWQADGPPKKIRPHWAGVPFDRIDAAVVLGETAFLFRKDEYVAYSLVACNVDPGYPKSLPGPYIEDWPEFWIGKS